MKIIQEEIDFRPPQRIKFDVVFEKETDFHKANLVWAEGGDRAIATASGPFHFAADGRVQSFYFVTAYRVNLENKIINQFRYGGQTSTEEEALKLFENVIEEMKRDFER